MKKILLILLCAACVLHLCGCLQIIDHVETTAPNISETTQGIAQETTPATTVSQETPSGIHPASLSLAMPYSTDEVLAENGTVLYSHTYPNPVFNFEDTAVVQKVLVDLLNQIDSSNAENAQILAAAQDNFTTQNAASWIPYFSNITYDVQRIDQNALSLLGTHVSFQGGVHPSCIPKSVTYDLVTGNPLALQDILTDNYSTTELCDLVLEALSPMSGELYGDYSSIVKDQFNGTWLSNKDWYLSDIGLCFYFAPYDIAPFASGIIVAEIPYGKLTDILLDAYFPPEAVPAKGKIEASLFHQSDIGHYNRFSEVILEADGERILLHTDMGVRDVTISQGSWSEDGTLFLAQKIVFASNSLNPQDAIVLQTFIPDTMPDLQLSYASGNEVITVYISQSGKDGTILLLTE